MHESFERKTEMEKRLEDRDGVNYRLGLNLKKLICSTDCFFLLVILSI